MRARVLEYSPLGPDGPRLRWREIRPRRYWWCMAYAWRALDRLGLGQRLGSCNLDAEIGRSPSDGTRRSPNNASNDVGPLAARCQIAQFRDAPGRPEAWRPHLAGLLGSHVLPNSISAFASAHSMCMWVDMCNGAAPRGYTWLSLVVPGVSFGRAAGLGYGSDLKLRRRARLLPATIRARQYKCFPSS